MKRLSVHFNVHVQSYSFSNRKAAINAPSLWNFAKTVLSGLARAARAQHCLLLFFNTTTIPASLLVFISGYYTLHIYSYIYSLPMQVEGGGGADFFYLQMLTLFHLSKLLTLPLRQRRNELSFPPFQLVYQLPINKEGGALKL
jgi:hypothetical protein